VLKIYATLLTAEADLQFLMKMMNAQATTLISSSSPVDFIAASHWRMAISRTSLE
jgi:hypothetical protein